MKIIVIDDDPTGSQTVHDCLLLLKWDYKTLMKGINSNSKILFILANTRSLSPNNLKIRLEEICLTLKKVISNSYNQQDYVLITRGDSTLRGHNFLEPYYINEFIGPFDATFYIPAFLEGNRITINGNHFVNNIPAHETIFAQDRVFGYETNNIKNILYKQSDSKINMENIHNLTLSELNILQMNENNKVFNFLENLEKNVKVIVDTHDYHELNKFASVIKTLIHKKKFLFRTAASFVKAISGINANNKDNLYYSNLRRKDKNNKFMQGFIVVGSHIDLSTKQLNRLLEIKSCKAIELNVFELYKIFSANKNDKFATFKNNLLDQIRNFLRQTYTPILFTSREVITFETYNEQIKFNDYISLFISQLVSHIQFEIGYLISKGGITTNTILSNAFNVDAVYLEGQIDSGISLVTVQPNHLDVKIPVVTFPGNIGDDNTLVKVWKVLENIEI
tara:strand:+ start:3195 stop:4544 length:1350 start_codon:yes stop_codon:yes gene_type:complete